MICAVISRSSRGLTAFTLPCVPTGINTGVSITPCAVFMRPRRAFDFRSCPRSSNIARHVSCFANLWQAVCLGSAHVSQKRTFDPKVRESGTLSPARETRALRNLEEQKILYDLGFSLYIRVLRIRCVRGSRTERVFLSPKT